jgi:excisionase family DNA binding protein
MNTVIHSTNDPATKNDPILIKKKELAKRLSVSPHTIDAWVQRREIPCIKVTPRLYLYELDAVMAAIRKKYGIKAA